MPHAIAEGEGQPGAVRVRNRDGDGEPPGNPHGIQSAEVIGRREEHREWIEQQRDGPRWPITQLIEHTFERRVLRDPNDREGLKTED